MRWSKRTDLLTVWKPLLVLAAYLGAMQLYPGFFATVSVYHPDTGEPMIDTSVLLELQLVVFVLVMALTLTFFDETFRPGSVKFLGTFKLGVWRAFLSRYLLLLLVLEALYLPFVALSFDRVNASIAANEALFSYAAGSCPRVDVAVPVFQCAVAMLFYVTVTVFLLMLLRNRLTVIICLAGYTALELVLTYTFYPNVPIFGYALFVGVIGYCPDLSRFAPPTVISKLVLSGVMLCATVAASARIYGGRRGCKIFP